MASLNESFPWLSYYGNYDFFEERMRTHSKVRTIKCKETGQYEITLVTEDVLKVFICECYSFGIAEYTEVISNLGPLDVIIINSNWCGYTTDAKFHCRGQKIGLFNIGDFMASLNRPDFWLYLNQVDIERYKKQGLL